MPWPDVEGIDCLVNSLYIGLLAESGPEAVKCFGLIWFVHVEEQCQAPLSMVFFIERNHLFVTSRRRRPHPAAYLLLVPSGQEFVEVFDIKPDGSTIPTTGLESSFPNGPPQRDTVVSRVLFRLPVAQVPALNGGRFHAFLSSFLLLLTFAELCQIRVKFSRE